MDTKTSNSILNKVTARTAAEVCKRFQLGEEAGSLLHEQSTPEAFLEALLEMEHFIDATRFLAHALPKREAVWWACLCSRQAHVASTPPVIAAALLAAEKWVADPKEEHRRAAFAAAEAAGFGTPAGCAAVAAFWSSGSLGPPDVAAIPPGEHLTGRGVANAIMLAAVMAEPEKAADKNRTFLALGIDVAKGTNRWK
jgi:hypothetical protein